MSEEDQNTLAAMVDTGGSFVRALAVAGTHADAENLQKIKDTWPEYWEKYRKLGNK